MSPTPRQWEQIGQGTPQAMAFYALQRHRMSGASRAGGITVASAGGLWPGAAALGAGAATHGPHLRPPAPPPPQGSRDRPDEPPRAKGA